MCSNAKKSEIDKQFDQLSRYVDQFEQLRNASVNIKEKMAVVLTWIGYSLHPSRNESHRAILMEKGVKDLSSDYQVTHLGELINMTSIAKRLAQR